jgi:hypothetical protein
MRARQRRSGLVALALVVANEAAGAQPAAAPPAQSAQLLPTFAQVGDGVSPASLRRPLPADGALGQRARELDMLLGGAAQDLGLTVRLSDRADLAPSEATEPRLLERAARGDWLLSPRLEVVAGKLLLRIVAVPPRSKVTLVRTELVSDDDMSVRAVVMLRDLVRAGREPKLGAATAPCPEAAARSAAHARVGAPRSEGRATLAVNAAILGGFVGYALQKSSGSDDSRLTYPLLAIGAGIGVGGSLIVAEEWDVGVGDAWYLSAGALWPTVGGLLVARGREVEPESDRWAYGIAGGLGGVTLAAVALSFGGIGEAGAAYAHSGGALGTGLGAGVELAARGSTSQTPYQGLGYGAVAGVVIGGVIGTQASGSGSRVLMIDLGAGLGALTGAAAASPLVFGERTPARDRGWIAATMAGGVLGGAVVYWWTAASAKTASGTPSTDVGRPLLGVVAVSKLPDGSAVPVYGVGWTGRF